MDQRIIINKIFLSAILVYLIMLFISTTYIWSGGSKSIFIFSVLWMVIIVPLYLLIKKDSLTIPFIIVNGIIGGLTIAAYFIHVERYIFINPIVGTGFIGFLLLNSIIINKAKNKRLISGIFSIIGLAIFIIAIDLLLTNQNVQADWIMLSSVIVICLNLSLRYWFKEGRKFEMNKVIRHYNMIMFGGVFFIVLTAITDGDTLEIIGELPVNDRKRKLK